MPPETQKPGNLVNAIVVAVHPLRVVLFGSAARGDTGPESDVDLLVVMPDGIHRRHTAQALYRQTRGIGSPFDPIVATRSDLGRHANDPGLIYATILREGKVFQAA